MTQIADEPTRTALKAAYFERLIRSDLGGPVSKAIERHDPATGALFEALAVFLEGVPPGILERSDHLITSILLPPAKSWDSLIGAARRPYWRMVRVAMRDDPGTARRIAWRHMLEPVFRLGAVHGPIGAMLASAILWTAASTHRVVVRLRKP